MSTMPYRSLHRPEWYHPGSGVLLEYRYSRYMSACWGHNAARRSMWSGRSTSSRWCHKLRCCFRYSAWLLAYRYRTCKGHRSSIGCCYRLQTAAIRYSRVYKFGPGCRHTFWFPVYKHKRYMFRSDSRCQSSCYKQGGRSSQYTAGYSIAVYCQHSAASPVYKRTGSKRRWSRIDWADS